MASEQTSTEISVVEPSEDKITPGPPDKVSLEDRQAVEVLYLKTNNLALQKTLLERDLAEATKQLKALADQMKAKGEELNLKYNITLGRDTIQEDGTIIRVPTKG